MKMSITFSDPCSEQISRSTEYFNYTNKEVDGILAEYEKARSTDSAKNAYHKLHKELAADLPYLSSLET